VPLERSQSSAIAVRVAVRLAVVADVRRGRSPVLDAAQDVAGVELPVQVAVRHEAGAAEDRRMERTAEEEAPG
jgi:hypothetical protein